MVIEKLTLLIDFGSETNWHFEMKRSNRNKQNIDQLLY